MIGNALVRFEFWELLVRISDLKYRQAGKTLTFSSGLQALITEHVLPYAKVFPWQSFRQEQLWTIDVNDLLEANLKSL